MKIDTCYSGPGCGKPCIMDCQIVCKAMEAKAFASLFGLDPAAVKENMQQTYDRIKSEKGIE